MKNKKNHLVIILGLFFLIQWGGHILYPTSHEETAIFETQGKVASSLKIIYFRARTEKASTDTLAARSAVERSSMGTSVGLGEGVTLTWRVEAVAMRRVTATITGVGSINLGTPRDLPGGGVYYENNRSVLPTSDTTYTLRVTGVPVERGEMAKVVEKSFRVSVRAPRLELQPPDVNQDTRRVELFVRNSGDADFRATPLQVHYVIAGQSPSQPLAENRFTTPAIEIRRGQRVSLGTTTLAERAWRSRSLRIRVQVDATYTAHLEDDQTFLHSWRENTITLNESSLRLVGMMFSGRIRVNNYNTSVRSDRVNNLPYVRNDSLISLMGVERTLDIPGIKLGSTPTEWFFFFNNINAPRIGGDDFLFIRDGKLGMHIEFDCSPSGEVKGWARDAIAKTYRDGWCPDVNITRLNLDILLTPTLRGQQISYSRVDVDSDFDLRITGKAWKPLDNNLVRRRVREYFSDYVNSQFGPILMNESIRREVEEGLDEVIDSMGTIHHIVDLRASGSQIQLIYR